MQLLEGPEPCVLDLFSRIRADSRHKNIVLLHECRMRERVFPDWKMGFHRLPDNESPLLEGFDPLLLPAEKPCDLPKMHPATKFLLKFKSMPPVL